MNKQYVKGLQKRQKVFFEIDAQKNGYNLVGFIFQWRGKRPRLYCLKNKGKRVRELIFRIVM